MATLAKRDYMYPSIGKMLMADDSEVDVADILNKIFDATNELIRIGIIGEDTADSTFKAISTIENTKFGSVALRVDIGMHITTYTAELTGNQTAVTIVTPSEGKKICVREVYTLVDGNAGTIAADFLTSEKKVHRHYSTGAGERRSITGGHVIGGADEVLTLNATSLGNSNLWIVVNYIEHE